MPALFTNTSIPFSCVQTFSINSSILSCSEISNFSTFTLGNSFFSASSLSIFVPVAKTLPSKEINFFTNEYPIPPVAPVI